MAIVLSLILPKYNVYVLFTHGLRLRQVLHFNLLRDICLVTLVATLHLPCFTSVYGNPFYATKPTITVKKQHVVKSCDRVVLLFWVTALQWQATLLTFFWLNSWAAVQKSSLYSYSLPEFYVDLQTLNYFPFILIAERGKHCLPITFLLCLFTHFLS